MLTRLCLLIQLIKIQDLLYFLSQTIFINNYYVFPIFKWITTSKQVKVTFCILTRHDVKLKHLFYYVQWSDRLGNIATCHQVNYVLQNSKQ